MATISIIGAGLSGLVAARELTGAGHEVTIYDKGRGVGGRLATRRVSDARLDHGAQFFTVRGEGFRRVVDDAIAAGAVVEWCRGFGAPDGYPRYRGADGMTSLAKHLADGLDVRLTERVTDLREVPADAFLVTAPIPQSLELLAASDLAPEARLGAELADVRYNRTIAGMFVLSEPSPMKHPGALQQPDDPAFTFVSDNMVKGISSVPALTVHASDAWSREHWDLSTEKLEEEMLAQVIAAGYFGEWSYAYDFQVHKWRYAGPQNPWPERYCVTSDAPLVVLAGDSFAGPKVEGAFNSGLAAGRELVARLG